MISRFEDCIEIDFVFKSDNQYDLKNYPKINDRLIFKEKFWENIFSVWIKILILEFKSSLPQQLLNKKSFSLSFEILNNDQIANLNKAWLNKSGPTDVISFPIITENPFENNLPFVELGDIFVSLEAAKKQSLEYNNSIHQEMIWLACHGFLHLLGWDHKKKEDLKEMLGLQEYLISKLDEHIRNNYE
tara:strand:- start:9450 stop:10013 length:564 start_codon:yes stop_codon:yes gene_type:complete